MDFELPQTSHQAPEQNNWLVLVVDDEPAIFETTKMNLRRFKFQDKPIDFLYANCAKQAIELLSQHNESIALVLLDVIMETNTSGLEVVQHIRQQLANYKTRVVLRTGQPGDNPEHKTIQDYDIDGYLDKSQMTKERLQSIVITSLRGYEHSLMLSDKTQLISLAGTIAHEMRNPLSILELSSLNAKRAVENWQDKLPESEKKTAGDIIHLLNVASGTVAQANHMIDILLNNIRTNQIDTHDFEHFSITEVVEDALNSFVFPKEHVQKRIHADLNQDFTFFGSDTLLQYVIFNLLRNVVYYMRCDEEIKVSIYSETVGNINQLTFKDTGPGIDEKRLATIFDSFVSSDKKEGTGLGLPFCKKVMKSFGGDISCQSTLGKHTTFVLQFKPV